MSRRARSQAPTRVPVPIEEILHEAVPTPWAPTSFPPRDRPEFHPAEDPYDHYRSEESIRVIRACNRILQKETQGRALPTRAILQALEVRVLPTASQLDQLLAGAHNSAGYRMFWWHTATDPAYPRDPPATYWSWNQEQLHPLLQTYNAFCETTGSPKIFDVMDIPPDLEALRQRCGFYQEGELRGRNGRQPPKPEYRHGSARQRYASVGQAPVYIRQHGDIRYTTEMTVIPQPQITFLNPPYPETTEVQLALENSTDP